MKKDDSRITAICHNQQLMMSGVLRGISEKGAELVCAQAGGSPPFPRKARVVLNLFEEKSGKAVNIDARITDLTLEEGAWSYRVRWGALPEEWLG